MYELIYEKDMLNLKKHIYNYNYCQDQHVQMHFMAISDMKM